MFVYVYRVVDKVVCFIMRRRVGEMAWLLMLLTSQLVETCSARRQQSKSSGPSLLVCEVTIGDSPKRYQIQGNDGRSCGVGVPLPICLPGISLSWLLGRTVNGLRQNKLGEAGEEKQKTETQALVFLSKA